jgi:hypothetical protein
MFWMNLVQMADFPAYLNTSSLLVWYRIISRKRKMTLVQFRHRVNSSSVHPTMLKLFTQLMKVKNCNFEQLRSQRNLEKQYFYFSSLQTCYAGLKDQKYNRKIHLKQFLVRSKRSEHVHRLRQKRQRKLSSFSF